MNDQGQVEWTAFEKWSEHFDDRQKSLIHHCRQYVTDGASGLPGHQLMLIVAQMAALLDAVDVAFPVVQKPQS